MINNLPSFDKSVTIQKSDELGKLYREEVPVFGDFRK